MNDAKDFTTGNILPKMIKFMLPILLALILQAMYGAVDLIVVGKFGTNEDLSGVATGSVIINTFTMVITSLASGVMVLIGRYVGEGRKDKLADVIGGAILAYGIFGIIYTILGTSLSRPLTLLMQAPAEAVDETIRYVLICGSGLIFIVAYNLLSSIFRGMGDSKTPLIFVGIACVTNIVGDLLFVAVFKMGVSGAALATIMAQAVSVILSVVIIKKRKIITLTRKNIRFNPEIKAFLKIGYPMGLQTLLTDISFMMICAFVNKIGLEASAGYGVAQKIVTFVMLVPSSIMQSMASFVSQNVGAGKEKRAKEALFNGMLIGGVIGVFVAAMAFFRGDLLAGIFTEDPAVVRLAHDFLRGFAPEAVLTSALFSFMGYFSGHGKTLFVMLQGLVQTFLIRVPFSYIMSIQKNPSLTHIGWAPPVATVFGILISLVYFFIYAKNLKKPAKITEND